MTTAVPTIWTRSPPILKWAACSLLLHGLVFGLGLVTWHLTGQPHAVSSQHPYDDALRNTLKASLVHPSSVDRPRHNDRPVTASANPVLPDEVAVATRHAPHTSLEAESEHADRAPPSDQIAERATDQHAVTHSRRARIQAHLFGALTRYFFYPAMARQRGWQGKVTLGFDVESDGRLGKIHVAQSSGYALLDQSALKALSHVKHLDDPGLLPSARIADMQLPVIYRLEDY